MKNIKYVKQKYFIIINRRHSQTEGISQGLFSYEAGPEMSMSVKILDILIPIHKQVRKMIQSIHVEMLSHLKLLMSNIKIYTIVMKRYIYK